MGIMLSSHPSLAGRGKNEVLAQFLSTETEPALPPAAVGVPPALLSELLVTPPWKTLHTGAMERSVLEEADSNKLALFRTATKIVLSDCGSEPRVLVGLLPKYSPKRNTTTGWKRQHKTN